MDVRQRQIEYIASIIAEKDLTRAEAYVVNAEGGWTVELSIPGREDGSWARYEGVVLSVAELDKACVMAGRPATRTQLSQAADAALRMCGARPELSNAEIVQIVCGRHGVTARDLEIAVEATIDLLILDDEEA